MDSNLLQHFARAYRLLQVVSRDFSSIDSPILVRLLVVLREQQTTLYQAILLLQQSHTDKEDLRYYIEVIYRDEEARDPLFRAWVRNVIWMGLESRESTKAKKSIMKQIRRELLQAVPYVEELYGKQETRYIIPPLMRKNGGM
ncbi:hypothetical protein [Bacillus fonticola]|uniref:hypothetical protein n=1 Tax=Bacillus fonticola TaxID=2728853 RepID=UPI0014754ADB|nr:hypothetical protein [Bacillus fonticola]